MVFFAIEKMLLVHTIGAMGMEFTTKNIKGHTVMKVPGSVELTNVGELKTAISALMAQPNTVSIILDLSEADYMDSSGIGVLISFAKKTIQQDIEFSLLKVTPAVLDVLEVLDLHNFFNIHATEDQIKEW